MSPLASGRLSHSSGPLNLTESESPPISPSDEFEDIVKVWYTFLFLEDNSCNSIFPSFLGVEARKREDILPPISFCLVPMTLFSPRHHFELSFPLKRLSVICVFDFFLSISLVFVYNFNVLS